MYVIIKKKRKREKKMNKRMFKKSPEELQQYLAFKRRGYKVPAKKGKGSYKRHEKHRNRED
jgi:stalled ribosome alternative rescue factor ArfA